MNAMQAISAMQDETAVVAEEDVAEENAQYVTIDVNEFLARLNKKLDEKNVETHHEDIALQSFAAPMLPKTDDMISCGSLSGKMFEYDVLSSLSVVCNDEVDCSISA